MSSIRKQSQLAKSESGMVAVMVTLIMMIVISLIVLGFAQISRRAQRSSLDAQLSTQAFYAAESGLNDAVAIMRQQIAIPAVIPKKDVCANTGPVYASLDASSVIGNASDNVSYTCVLIDPTPKDISYTLGSPSLTSSSSEVVKLKSATGQTFKSITYSWTPEIGQANTPLANCPLVSQYPVAAPAGGTAWTCKFPVLRTELTPTDSLTRDGLMDNTHVNFLEPVSSGASPTFPWASNATSVAASCAAVCTATVDFGAVGGATSYYLRVNPLYVGTTLTISAKAVGGADIEFGDVQAKVSVTGKSQDVLRRILVAVSLDGKGGNAPTASIMSGDTVCKRFTVTGGSFSKEQYDGDNGNALCDSTLSTGTPTNP